MRLTFLLVLAAVVSSLPMRAQTLENKPADPYYSKFDLIKAPPVMGLQLRKDDRLAICGDSITEQKMYSRIMETYLTVCAPELNISVRQFGWSGERAPGFLKRMTNDCLRFQPNVATTCYGMNDHEYRAYEDRIGNTYRDYSTRIIEAFKAHHVRCIEGSAGCVGKTPTWVGDTNALVEQLNLNLCKLRNIAIEVAEAEHAGFADVFWPMLMTDHAAHLKYGPGYTIAGGDGVHPGWAGHLLMAYAFLHSLGLDGNLGTFTVDMGSGKASVTPGHELVQYKDGELEVKSSRYPFCIGEGDLAKSDNIHSGTQWVPFNHDLNRMLLVVKNGAASKYQVTWGSQSKIFTAEQLADGINLPAEFLTNPFSEAFKKVDEAVAAKQAYETKQIKQLFRGPEAKKDMEGTVEATEKDRQPLVAAVKAAFVPVTHTIKITPR